MAAKVRPEPVPAILSAAFAVLLAEVEAAVAVPLEAAPLVPELLDEEVVAAALEAELELCEAEDAAAAVLEPLPVLADRDVDIDEEPLMTVADDEATVAEDDPVPAAAEELAQLAAVGCTDTNQYICWTSKQSGDIPDSLRLQERISNWRMPEQPADQLYHKQSKHSMKCWR